VKKILVSLDVIHVKLILVEESAVNLIQHF